MGTTYTLSGDFAELLGDNIKSINAYVRTNLPANTALIDTTATANSVRLGTGKINVASDGTFSVTLLGTANTGMNVAANTLRYEVVVPDYVDPGTRQRRSWSSGFFPLTANTNLKDVAVDVDPIAVASASGYALEAATSATEAQAFRDEAEALIVSDLGTTDGQTRALIEAPGSQTAVALSATYAPGVSVKAYGATGDGTTDDTAAIQAALDAAAPFGATVHVPSGDYRINPVGANGASRGLVPPSNTTLVMADDATLRALPDSTGTSAVISIANADRVTIRGGEIIGDRSVHVGTTGEHGMGITVLHSSNVVIDSVKIRDCWGDCIYVGGNNWGLTGAEPTGVTITNCILDNARRQGVSVTLANGVRILDCTVTNINGIAPQYGIDIETNDPAKPVLNVAVRGCKFSGSTGGGLVVGANARGLLVADCTFDGDNLVVTQATDVTATGNLIKAAEAIVARSTGVLFNGNTFSSSYFQVDSSTSAVTAVTLANNTFDNADGSTTRRAIQATGTAALNGFTVTGNLVRNFKTHSLYMASYTGRWHVANNTFTSTVLTGEMFLLRGTDCTFANNTVDVALVTPASVTGYPATVTMIRGSFSGNAFTVKDATLAETVILLSNYAGETVGATLSGNRISSTSGKAIKFPTAAGDTAYRVSNNDLRGVAQPPFMNDTVGSHHLIGNITGATGRELEGTAAPTTGTWERGAKYRNSLPSAGGYLGWVCVTPGTPGVWKGYGLIEA